MISTLEYCREIAISWESPPKHKKAHNSNVKTHKTKVAYPAAVKMMETSLQKFLSYRYASRTIFYCLVRYFTNSLHLIFISQGNTGNLWIGLKKLGNKFYWMANNYQTIREINSDEASNWWPGKPDTQGDTQGHSGFCGYMWAARGLHVNWDDQYCSQHYNFICQKDM